MVDRYDERRYYTMPDIFLSYANVDLERARPVAKVLEAQGWTV